MTHKQNLKQLVLVALIALGAVLQSHGAQAADQRTLIVAGGCFWCVESDFEKVAGVSEAISGYAGGSTNNPTYKQVTQGGTGHYEAVQITYDPDVVTLDRLLFLFLRSIDPTDAGGQFCDRGDSYRSAIFVSDPREKSAAKAAISTAAADLGQKVVTPVLSKTEFFPAEAYHQDYYKGSNLILTRFGPKRQAEAYKKYRAACGRDAKVQQLWGSAAPFATGH